MRRPSSAATSAFSCATPPSTVLFSCARLIRYGSTSATSPNGTYLYACADQSAAALSAGFALPSEVRRAPHKAVSLQTQGGYHDSRAEAAGHEHQLRTYPSVAGQRRARTHTLYPMCAYTHTNMSSISSTLPVSARHNLSSLDRCAGRAAHPVAVAAQHVGQRVGHAQQLAKVDAVFARVHVGRLQQRHRALHRRLRRAGAAEVAQPRGSDARPQHTASAASAEDLRLWRPADIL